MYKYDLVEYDIPDIKGILVKDKSVIILSDLHDFTRFTSDSDDLARLVKDENPHHILIAGDILKGIHWDDKKELQKLHYFLSNLSEESPVYVQVGNHDKMNMSKTRLTNFYTVDKARPGMTHLMLNDSANCDMFKIIGYTPSDYVESNMAIQKSGIAHNAFVKEFEKEGPSIDYTSDQIVEFLGHNPHIIAQGYSEQGLGSLKNVDMFATGHLHNGYFDLIKNRDIDRWKDRGFTQIPICKDINGKIVLKSIRPLYGRIGQCRGTIFVDNDANQRYLLLRNGHMYINEDLNSIDAKWTLCDKDLALTEIIEYGYKALVISGGVRKFFFLEPFDKNILNYKPEITKVNYKARVLK